MVVETITWFIGVSSLILLLLGYIYCILFLVKYIYVKKILVPIVAMVAFCCGSFYLGPSVSFLSLLINGVNIDSSLYFIISYVWMPIGAMGIIIMALNVFKPKLQKPAVCIFSIISIIFWIFMFGFTESQYSVTPIQDGYLLDVSHANVSLVITALILLSIFVIDGGGFFFLARKLKKNNYPKKEIHKARMIGIGWFLFVISGVMDALLPAETIGFIVFVRGLMVIAFNFIYLGFWSKPTRLTDKSGE